MQTAPEDLTLLINQEIAINAPVERAFSALLAQLGGLETPEGDTLNFALELRPGGRWYRDLGNDNGHLWGFVQVIKRPFLLELCGPLFMSHPVLSHLQFRITAADTGCTLTLRHEAFGPVRPEHREGVGEGWAHMLEGVRRHAENH